MSNREFKVRDRRDHGYYTIDTAFIRGGWAAALGPYGVAIYTILACHVSNDGQRCYPKQATIAELAGCSERQVREALSELEACNIIARIEQRRENGRRAVDLIDLLHRDEWKPPTVIEAIRAEKKAQWAEARQRHKAKNPPESPATSQQPESPAGCQPESPAGHELTPSSGTNPKTHAPVSGAGVPDDSSLEELKKQCHVTFFELTRIKPLKSQVSDFNGSIKQMVEEFGTAAPALMRQAYEVSKQKPFEVLRPGALLKKMNGLYCQPPPAAPNGHTRPARTQEEEVAAYKAKQLAQGGK